jgi:hypothetical protein
MDWFTGSMEAPRMSRRRELLAFAAVLAGLVGGFLGESLFGGKILSPADVVFVQASFAEFRGPGYEPANRLLMDPVLQFQPWLEFNRAMLRRGRLPLWNPLAGCGAPHLANGQSAVFDPFHVLAYLGRLPDAYAWMAAARLWFAGLGMFLLVRRWSVGPWGRWFAGLLFPCCGFLVVWLLFPVTSTAVWMPWLLWASDRVVVRPTVRAVGLVGLFTGCLLLGGHVQTAAHVLVAAAVYMMYRTTDKGRRTKDKGQNEGERYSSNSRQVCRSLPFGLGPWSIVHCPRPSLLPPSRGGGMAWWMGIGLGVSLAAIELLPLGFYLTRSPVWADRDRERPAAWSLGRPRTLDAACTALPYAYGSQRRGHPNLARALGVHNLNESAGGFAGLATLAALVPAGLMVRPRPGPAVFLAGLAGLGALAAFEVPPVANLLRLVPMLNVIDHRRLTLWVAFGLTGLGGIGLDSLASTLWSRSWLPLSWLWVAGASGLMALGVGISFAGPRLEARAREHYARAARETPGADLALYSHRAELQVRQVLHFVPRYAFAAAGQLVALCALVGTWRRGRMSTSLLRPALFALALADVLAFGYGLNPAIARGEDRPEGAVIAYLRREAPPPARILALGAELPPNVLMRYGLADVRNYDSVEMQSSLDWFAPLFEPGSSRTSRRTITWDGVLRALDRLKLARVAAIVGPTPPPEGAFAQVDRVGGVWIARLEGLAAPPLQAEPGEIEIDAAGLAAPRLVVAETYDPGWIAEVDGRRVPVAPHRGAFLEVPLTPDARRVVLRYDPREVRVAAVVSCLALLATAWALAGSMPAWTPKKAACGLGSPRGIALESVA